MSPKAVQTAGPIGLNFFVDTHRFFSNYFFQKFFVFFLWSMPGPPANLYNKQDIYLVFWTLLGCRGCNLDHNFFHGKRRVLQLVFINFTSYKNLLKLIKSLVKLNMGLFILDSFCALCSLDCL